MSNEKYINYYIDTLVNTLTDCVVRNVSLQANAKVIDDVVNEQSKHTQQLQSEIENLKKQTLDSQNAELNIKDSTITNLKNEIERLNGELKVLVNLKSEYENVKHQVKHIETFRNELQKERELHQKALSEINELNKKIEYLQLTPAKRRKVDDLNKQNEHKPENQIEDGGTF